MSFLDAQIWQVIQTIAVPILVGAILLILEYRTRWFANYFSTKRDNTINDDSIDRPFTLGPGKVTSVDELETPVGDWMQIAEEVKSLIMKSTENDRDGEVNLQKISKGKLKNTMQLEFSYMATSLENTDTWGLFYIYVTVTKDGRIIDYLREQQW